MKYLTETYEVNSITNEELVRLNYTVSGDALHAVIERAEPVELLNRIEELEQENEELNEQLESLD